ncbi:MAG: hypothetical protein ACOCQN_00600 [Halanaerobiaceae bacterium]
MVKFIRVDGHIYEQDHEEAIERLEANNNFKKLEDLTVTDLKKYANNIGIDDPASDREKLIEQIDSCNYTNYGHEIAYNQTGELV